MASPRLAFVLNFDAEHELEAGARWTAPMSLRARLADIARATRLPEGAILLTPGTALPPGYEGRLWCPTPRAVAQLRAAGATVPDAPDFDVVRRVNERGFAAALAEGELEPTLASSSLEVIEAFVSARGPTGRWRLKRGLGASGRGQRTLEAGPLSADARSWIRNATRFGPLYVEPHVVIERELAVYGWVRRDRGVELTGIRGQTTDAHGHFVRCGRVDAADVGPHATPLREAAERVGVALLAAGYHGPFGIDGYLYRTARGALRLRAISEINARYCMGWDERDGF
ncbi:MAG: hypothetical protein OHK0013_22500 [Sandaracinaceae bacterium]